MSTEMKIFDPSELFTLPGEDGEIGCGSFATVRFCKTLTLEQFAVKCFKITGSAKENNIKAAKSINEAKVLLKASHSYIMKIYGIVRWTDCVGVVSEYLPGGNLDGFLRNEKLTKIPWGLRLRMALQLSEAISFLHTYKPRKSLVHGDIKPENILLTYNLLIKLSDFGAVNIVTCLGASKTTTNLPTSHQHTPYYTAPEYLKDIHKESSPQKDVFSFGVVLYEFLTRSRPYENATAHPSVLLQVIVDRGQRPDQRRLDEIKNDLSADDLTIFKLLVEQMKQCWSQEPTNRPEMQTVFSSFLSTFEKIEQTVLDEQIRNVIECLGITSKDFDLERGIEISSIFSDDVTQIELVSSSLDNSEYNNVSSSFSPNNITDECETNETTEALTERNNVSLSISENFETDESAPVFTNESTIVSPSEDHLERNSVSLPASENIRNEDSTLGINAVPSTEDLTQQILESVQSINLFLQNNQVMEALDHCHRLFSKKNVSVTEGFDAMVFDVINLGSSLTSKFHYVTAKSMLKWIIKLLSKINNSEIKLKKMDNCRLNVHNLANESRNSGKRAIIASYCLPLLEKLLLKIKQIQYNDTEYKALVEARCMYSIGVCLDFIQKYEQAQLHYQSLLRHIDSVFGINAKKHKVVADCYYATGLLNVKKKRYFNANKYFNLAIETYKTVENISEKDKAEKLTNVKQWIDVVPVKRFYDLTFGNACLDNYHVDCNYYWLCIIISLFLFSWFCFYFYKTGFAEFVFGFILVGIIFIFISSKYNGKTVSYMVTFFLSFIFLSMPGLFILYFLIASAIS